MSKKIEKMFYHKPGTKIRTILKAKKTKLIIKTSYLKQDILPHGNIAIG